MRTFIISFICLCMATIAYASLQEDYQSLDTRDPIVFKGNYIVYQGKRIDLGAKSLFIDGRFAQDVNQKYPYVFNSVAEAVKHLTNGTEQDPMVLHIAPSVYWIDNPDDATIRIAQEGEKLPYGLIIKCDWLTFNGLTNDPRNVVLACNRGQTMGAKGNFTMFKLIGDGTATQNITLGNYCNVDLEYPLNPALNRKKRGSAIVQAQLALTNGDKIYAKNTRFISRLNLCPFYGSGKRVFFENCHFESTDDALCKTGVYLNCTLDFYSSKPFGSTTGTGSVFLNCDIRSFSDQEQYFTKGGGQVAVVDSRLETQTASYWGWRDFPWEESRNYQYNVTLNKHPFVIGGSRHPSTTVEIRGKPILDAYRFHYNSKPVYNLYNLLSGNDGWDPANLKTWTQTAEKKDGKQYTNLPIKFEITPSRETIETGKMSLTLHPKMKRFGDFDTELTEAITWEIDKKYQPFVKMRVNDDQTCEIIPNNVTNCQQAVIVKARSASGLESASLVYVLPAIFEAPQFVSMPHIVNKSDSLLLDYTLASHYEDHSQITWYRCADKNGSKPIEIAVTRMNVPKKEYVLSAGDIGSYIMAIISPKHIRSHAGKTTQIVTSSPIQATDITQSAKRLQVDFKSLSAKYQPEVKPGYWTLDCYAPEDIKEFPWEADNSLDPWLYGAGINGAVNDTGFVQAIKGARLRYTPVGNAFGNMKISFVAVPAKTAGQGFSSATAQYMDIFIKFDTKNMNGYALRLVRTTKYHDAIDFVFMRYENGKAYPIGQAVSASCYRPNCYITLEVKGKKLIVHAEPLKDYADKRSEVKKVVDMDIEITPNEYGGMGFQHTGTVRGGASLIKDLIVEWQ